VEEVNDEDWRLYEIIVTVFIFRLT
jgi:hypothetical protein